MTEQTKPEKTGWRTYRERATGRVFRARWEADHHLPGGGAWEVEGELAYVDPAQAAEEWEAWYG